MDLPPLVIAVAPNGARKSKLDHPAIPITPAELAVTAQECLDAGAAMMHLHVRDTSGQHCLDADTYRAAITAIQRAVGDRLVIQVTSEAAGVYHPQQQMAQIRQLKPEAVSIALREFLTAELEPAALADFLKWLSQEHITPQYILFSQTDADIYQQLIKKGVIPTTPHWLLYVLGRNATGFTSVMDAACGQSAREAATPWAVCAFGQAEYINTAQAVTLGGHVRVGFENNLYLRDGTVAGSNSDLVAQARDVARSIGRPVADAHFLRQWL